MGNDYGEGQHRHHGDDADYLHHGSRVGPNCHVDIGHRGCFLEVDRVGLPVGCRSSDRGAPPGGVDRPEPSLPNGS